MRTVGIVVLLTLHWVYCIAQQGNQWITGFGNIIDFNNDTANSYMQCDTFNNAPYHFGHSSICDSNGELLFAYTGILPIQKCINIIENGKPSINNHFATESHGHGELIQQSIILPKTGTQYYAIYSSASNVVFDSAQSGGEVYFDQLFYDLIDMNANGGDGKVIDKYHPITLEGKMSINSMSAIRHANGRDWWLVKPHINKHFFYSFLATPDKVEGPFEQDMNGPDFISNNWGQSNFSQDGQYYALTQYGSESIQINTFDRCSGKMSKYRSVSPPIDTNWYYDPIYMKDTFELISAGTGVCFSPNNKFLYIVTPISVWQYDMNTEEIINLNTDTFYNGALNITAYNAPDGRIYTGNWNGTNYGLSYIEFPNTKGKDAHFCQICLPTPFTTSVPPNMPNYELGVLKGSSCDTIRPPKPIHDIIKIYPNPVSENLTIELPTGSKKVHINIYNMLGEIVLSYTSEQIQNDKVELSLKHLARALYSTRINVDGNNYVGKLVKE